MNQGVVVLLGVSPETLPPGENEITTRGKGKREKGKGKTIGKREKGKGKRENAEAHRRLAVDQLD